nr:MAG TPA: YopX protein [Caudoviricetes sp.]
MLPKFRTWDKRENTMRDVAVLHFNKGGKVNYIEYWKTPSELKSYHVRNLFLMQSTGLKDKNGVEIFEGDLVKITVSNGFDHLEDALSIVKEAEYHSGLICELLSNTLEYRIFDEEATGYQYEIVGNIYKNPELLEQSNEN